MKTIKYMFIATLGLTLVGCALTEKLPSVTVGGAANKKAVLDASLNKSGISVTAPLVSVDVPFPSVKAVDDK
jgi:hypothetical protein